MAKQTVNDTVDSPNPILENPIGLFSMYDEIWFLCESLCPITLRKMNCVKFVDREFPNLLTNGRMDEVKDNSIWLFGKQNVDSFVKSRERYHDVRRNIGIYWKHGQDNHSHVLQIGNLQTSANSWDTQKVLQDYKIQSVLPFKAELVYNSFTSELVWASESGLLSSGFAHSIIIKNMRNPIRKKGPDVDIIEEVRQNRYLHEFREFILNRGGSVKPQEIKQHSDEINRIVEKKFNKLVDAKYGDRQKAASIAKILLSTASPISGKIMNLLQLGAMWRSERRQESWQAFLMTIRK